MLSTLPDSGQLPVHGQYASAVPNLRCPPALKSSRFSTVPECILWSAMASGALWSRRTFEGNRCTETVAGVARREPPNCVVGGLG